jgi:hypothetical protein
VGEFGVHGGRTTQYRRAVVVVAEASYVSSWREMVSEADEEESIPRWLAPAKS